MNKGRRYLTFGALMVAAAQLAGCYAYHGPNYRPPAGDRKDWVYVEKVATLRTQAELNQYQLQLTRKHWLGDPDRPSAQPSTLGLFRQGQAGGQTFSDRDWYGYWRFDPVGCVLRLYDDKGRLVSTLAGQAKGEGTLAYVVTDSKQSGLARQTFFTQDQGLRCLPSPASKEHP
ncbi:hypothetical protein [Gallaecimonas xiamenensis]|uniref:Uncharacterized protein n=1 Tax=Gallaecimonas xiamenensis 3-C-1 TaxID=745411 RepID=K2IYP8_9GAMM|nr:hypothetical protein [Gallaecimonas xiamenensis]EKE68038.1 hypothetical protein B3C1_17562 [Gallaecimonas xiamenensis 3-C-1]